MTQLCTQWSKERQDGRLALLPPGPLQPLPGGALPLDAAGDGTHLGAGYGSQAALLDAGPVLEPVGSPPVMGFKVLRPVLTCMSLQSLGLNALTVPSTNTTSSSPPELHLSIQCVRETAFLHGCPAIVHHRQTMLAMLRCSAMQQGLASADLSLNPDALL